MFNGINVDGDSTITNTAGGLETSSLKSAIAVTNGSHSVITNSGTISSTATDGSPAIALLFGGTVVNYASGVITGNDGMAISVGFQPNYGIISGNVDGINNNSDSQITNEAGGLITSSMEPAIAVSYGSHSIITNSGTISSTATDGSPAIALFVGGTVVNNASGVITGNDGKAITVGFQGNRTRNRL